MGVSGMVIQPVGEGNFEASVQFLAEWVSDGEAEARRYLAGHAEPQGASLIATLGITVGLFDEYGPAQRLYGQRGYIPDGRGACRGQQPLSKGIRVTVNDDLIMWLTKDLVS